MSAEQSRQHHYVAQWYQKRFLPPGQAKLYYLDLKPNTVVNGAISYTVKALRYWDPARCFCVEDLYAMKFGQRTSDAMERRFFGNVDRNGAAAADYLRAYEDIDDRANDAVLHLVNYIGAQRFRTPRGLDWIQARIGSSDRTSTLLALQELFQAYAAMWMEGVWEIVDFASPAWPHLMATFGPTQQPILCRILGGGWKSRCRPSGGRAPHHWGVLGFHHRRVCFRLWFLFLAYQSLVV